MTATQVDEWVRRLNAGTLDLSDLRMLDRLEMDQVLEKLSDKFPVRFLEGQQRNKREIGLARTRRRQKYNLCMLLTSESERLTTLATMTFLRIRSSEPHDRTVEFTSGAGFSLYRDPDGWKIKLLEERKVSLSRAALKKRGWRLLTSSKRT